MAETVTLTCTWYNDMPEMSKKRQGSEWHWNSTFNLKSPSLPRPPDHVKGWPWTLLRASHSQACSHSLSIVYFFFLFLHAYLFERWGEVGSGSGRVAGNLPSTDSFSVGPQYPEWGQVKATSQKLHPGFHSCRDWILTARQNNKDLSSTTEQSFPPSSGNQTSSGSVSGHTLIAFWLTLARRVPWCEPWPLEVVSSWVWCEKLHNVRSFVAQRWKSGRKLGWDLLFCICSKS